MAKANKKDQDATVVVPIPEIVEQVEQAIQGAAAVAEAPVSKDSLPTPPAPAKTTPDAATSEADFEKFAALSGALAGNTVKAFIVTAARNGFRRAGIQFSTEPTTLHTANLTQEQIHLIMHEPMLEVVSVEAVAE